MEKLSIKKISKSFFRTTYQKLEGHQTNPFGASFKGSVITADVFETKKTNNLIERVSDKSKMLSNVMMKSMNKFASVMDKRVNSIVSFTGRIKENVSRFWEHAKSIEITFGE